MELAFEEGSGVGQRATGRVRANAVSSRPILVPVEALRPTQMAVGMRAVTFKRRKIEARVCKRKQIEKVLSGRPIPAVRGPGGDLFIIDHHHFGLALWQAEVTQAYARVIEDLSHLPAVRFWSEMEDAGRLYPFDEDGRRIAPERLPTWLHALRHDSFRDLAWEVREAGGFRKVAVPYAEFRWANFFREHISQAIVRRDYEGAVRRGLKLARSSEAEGLPGYVE